MADFGGLDKEHFDTYLPSKWSSMVHNLARMKTKSTMIALGDTTALGLDDEIFGQMVRGASDEIPNISNQKKVDSQWIYWFRSKQDREQLSTLLGKTVLEKESIFNTSAHDKHITLTLILSHEKFWVGIQIAPNAKVDRLNLAAKLQVEEKPEVFLNRLANLPTEAVMGFGDNLASAVKAPLENMKELTLQLAESDQRFYLGFSYAIEEASDLGINLVGKIRENLNTLIPCYRFMAWSKQNDFIGATKQIRAEQSQKQEKAKSLKEGDKVRITSGLLSGQIGVVDKIDAKMMTKVSVGKMSMKVPSADLIPVR
ncbi:MAG: hypothetical protein VYA34_14905 [Myxococcota bacterium]|nr:hypothetical protein [Myxococcota bacterium]